MRRARKSIANFKLREGMPVGLAVTLRDERAYEFLDRLISIAIPRIRDFRGLNPRSFDGRGNYSMGVREQIIFPEIDYDAIDQVRGLDITITTTARTDDEAFALLEAFGMPFARDGRPARPEGEARSPSRRNERRPWRRPHSACASSAPAKYKTRAYTRCRRCGRPRAVYRKFGVCRICLRELAHNGLHPRHDEAQLVVPPCRMTDPIADFLTRIRNAIRPPTRRSRCPRRKLKAELARILTSRATSVATDRRRPARAAGEVISHLKYTEDRRRRSRGCGASRGRASRTYVDAKHIPKVLGGMGTAIVSTSRGVMTGHERARPASAARSSREVW